MCNLEKFMDFAFCTFPTKLEKNKQLITSFPPALSIFIELFSYQAFLEPGIEKYKEKKKQIEEKGKIGLFLRSLENR